MDETLARFQCKMSLNWKPELKKFAFKAADGEWQTKCSFEGTSTDGAASGALSPPLRHLERRG